MFGLAWSQGGSQALLLTCFVLSGVSGLVYEVVWTRKLTLYLGSTTLATSISLAAYLGGLALGAWLLGVVADRLRRPAAVYGALEVAIGAYGLVSLRLLDAVGPLYVRVQAALAPASWWGGVAQFALVGAVLVVPTVLMGGTLPVLVRATGLAGPGLGDRVGRLYAANTAGAVAGVALAGFVLLPRLGLFRSVLLAAAVNLGLGLVVLARFGGGREALAPEGPSAASAEDPAPAWPLLAGLVVFVSGFCALFYEVVWTRALELVLGTSTWAFSLMLTTFLLGLSLGIGLGGRLVRGGRAAPTALWLVQAGVGVSVFFTAGLLQALPGWFVALYARFAEQPALFRLAQAGLCMMVLLVPALLIGMVFPLAVALSGVRTGREGRTVGRLYAVNTVGSILGAFLAGLVVIPAIGMHRALLAGVWMNLGLAAAIGTQVGRCRLAVRLAAVVAPLALGGLLSLRPPAWDAMTMTSGPFLYAPRILRAGPDRVRAVEAESRLLFYREGTSGTVTVKERRGFRYLAIDGRGEGGTTAAAQILLGHLPFVFEASIRDVFVIGFGTGSTAGATTRYPVERIDVVDLAPSVVEASRFFEAINHRPLDDPRVRVRIADARSVLLATPPAAYDLILSQPSHPWVPGAAKLFTAEFYRLVRDRLRPGGLFAQWVQLYNLDREGLVSLLGTFADAFADTVVVEVGGRSSELILVGGRDRVRLAWDAVQELFADPLRVRDLGRIGLTSPGALLARIMMGSSGLRTLVGTYTPNTDDNGLLEFRSLGDLYAETTDANRLFLRGAVTEPWAHVSGIPPGTVGQTVLVDMAAAAHASGDHERGLAFIRAALALGATAAAYRIEGDLLYAAGHWDAAVVAWRRALDQQPGQLASLRRLVRHYRAQWEGRRPPEFGAWVARLREAGQSYEEEAPALPPAPDAASAN